MGAAPPARRGIGLGAWLAVGAGVLLIAILAGALVWSRIGQRHVAADRAAARQMASEADAMLASGNLPAAHEKYGELSDFLASHDRSDPEMAKLATRAHSGEERVFSALLARVSEKPVKLTNTPAPVSTAAPSASAHGLVASSESSVASQSIALSKQQNPAVSAPPATAPSASATTQSAVPTRSPDPARAPVPSPAPSPVVHARPPTQPVKVASDELTDQEIGRAIQRGVDHLIESFDPKTFELPGGPGAQRVRNARGRARRGVETGMHDGADTLCVYALLQCGQAISDPRLNLRGPFMIGCINAMKKFPMDEAAGYTTYGRGLRATALALADRPEDHEALARDVLWLLQVQKNGGYTYVKSTGNYDNSNSQYGLLGVWSGAEAGIEVPNAYWELVQRHWTSCQNPNGQWGYVAGSEGTLTMTCAGIASMFVCHDWLDAPKFGAQVGREPFSAPLKRGLGWMEQGDHSVGGNSSFAGHFGGYALYGIERVGLASGFKFFGNHNWYPELARRVLDTQHRDGSWGDDINTAYTLLFLARGRHPILMNKLRFDGYWANRPRDVANLAREASVRLERPINWQVVPLARQWTDWLDSPILYLASHKPPELSDADVHKIRQYVDAGGMLFVQADGDAAPMTGFARHLAHRLFPMYEMTDAPRGHPLFSSLYKLTSHPPMKMVSNGSRILMLFSPYDISKRWQLREEHGTKGKPIFDLGVNMFIYAAGKRDLRNRLETNYIAPVAGTPSLTVKIARVRYAGNWNPEPYAWTRFARWFHEKTGYALDVRPVAMRDLDAKQFPFAHLTGTAAYRPTEDEVKTVKHYVESGGVLLIDLTGGTGAFDTYMRDNLLAAAWPRAGIAPQSLPSSHPLFRSGPSGMEDLAHPHLRPYAVEKIGNQPTGHLAEISAGTGHVLFTNLDITSGLLNTGTWGIVGYEPAYSQALMKNAILWALDGQKDQ